MSHVIQPPAFSIVTVMMAPSKTPALRPEQPSMKTASHKREWGSPRLITITTDFSIFSKQTSPTTALISITTTLMELFPIVSSRRVLVESAVLLVGEHYSWITTTTVGATS